MAYGNDATVFVEDTAGDLGAPAPGGAPFWLSPDVDIPAHPGEATQGSNTVQIRVHAHEEPIIEERIVAEVYVGNPSLVMSPGANTVRIDPGNLRVRPPNLAGTEPVANIPGGTTTFAWTPSTTAGAVDGAGHRCLIVRAFPESVTPPTSAFTVPIEQHEAQRNIEILNTQMKKSKGGGGKGTKRSPRRRDTETGLWFEDLDTLATGRKVAKRFVVWAFDPEPSKAVVGSIREGLRAAGSRGFSKEPPQTVRLSALDAPFQELDPQDLLARKRFARRAGLGQGLFAENRLLAAASVELRPRKASHIRLGFDHSNIRTGSAVVLHVVQFTDTGAAEGGMTIAAIAPR